MSLNLDFLHSASVIPAQAGIYSSNKVKDLFGRRTPLLREKDRNLWTRGIEELFSNRDA